MSLKRFINTVALAMTALSAVVLAGCGGGEVVELSTLHKRGDVYVSPKTQKPFSGRFVETEKEFSQLGQEGGTVRRAGTLRNGKFHGEFTEYCSNGNIEKVSNYRNGVLHGKYSEFSCSNDEENFLFIAGNYKDGKKDGKWKYHYANKRLWFAENYKNDQEHGRWEYYNEDGQLAEVKNYSNGKLDGKHESYYENGQLASTRNYKNGVSDGRWETYYQNGQIETVKHYKNGVEDGKWEWYDEDGQLSRTVEYQDGRVVNTIDAAADRQRAASLEAEEKRRLERQEAEEKRRLERQEAAERRREELEARRQSSGDADNRGATQLQQPAASAAPRFRIQILATEEEALARSEKQKAEAATNRSVMIGTEQSMYKVYVGEFNTRAEAAAVLPEIKRGYPDAWIVNR